MADMLERGTKKHSRQEIQDKFDKLHAEVSIFADVGLLGVTLRVKRANLAESLDLLTEILREPSFPEKEFELLKAEVRDALDKGRTEPQVLAFQEIARKMAPYPKDHPLYHPTLDEEMEQVKSATLKDVTSLYAEQMSAQAAEVAVLGDFDPEPTLKQIKTMLSDWKSTVPHKRISRPAHPEVPGSRTVINTPDKANSVWVAGLSFPVGDTDPDAVPLEVGNYIFGSGSLVSRLGIRIREKEGLSYTVMSHLNSSPRDKASSFMMFAIANPKNVDKVEKAVAEELDLFLKSGPSLSELTDALKGYLDSKKVSRTKDQNLAMSIVNNLNLGRQFAFEAEQEKKAAALSPEEIKEAFRKHIDPKKLVIIRAGDFEKK
jgi:zinc protease